MSADSQSIIAVALAILAAIWAAYMVLTPLIASLRPAKPGSCAGGCGCAKEEKASKII